MSSSGPSGPSKKGASRFVEWIDSFGTKVASEHINNRFGPVIKTLAPATAFAGEAVEHRGPGIANQNDHFGKLTQTIIGKGFKPAKGHKSFTSNTS